LIGFIQSFDAIRIFSFVNFNLSKLSNLS